MGLESVILLAITLWLALAPAFALAQGVPAPPVITQQPHDISAPEGGSAVFTVTATGDPLTYQWLFRAQGAASFLPVPTGTNATLIITNVQASDEGVYQVVVSNPFGSTPSEPAALVLEKKATRFQLYCRDGKFITNGCVVTITLTNASGYSNPKVATPPDGNPYDFNYWTLFSCQGGLDPNDTWWFLVTASCCTNVWLVPTTKCYGDFEPLKCDSCGDCPLPRITCPTAVELLSSCGDCVPYNYPNPAVTGGGLVGCNPPSGTCFSVGVTVVTCTATNQCGDVVACEFPVTVRSCLKCPPSRIYECGRRWDFDVPTVEAGCAQIQFGVLSTVTNGICPQTITRTWSVVMECGGGLGQVTQCQQVITVVDTTPPILACAPDKSVLCDSDWGFDPPSVADDGCSPIAIQVLSTVTNFPCSAQTAIVRTWIATDACGNSSTCSQTVYLDQTGRPLVQCPPDKSVDCGADWSFDPPLVVSSCSPVSIRVASTETNGACPVRVTRTWMIDDQCGHLVECSQTITLLNASSLQTVFTLFSGRDSSGLLPLGAADPQFTFGCLPPNTGPATPTVTTPDPLWLPNGPQSQWIGPGAGNYGDGGTYCYQVEFNLPSCPTGTPVYTVRGRWAADDSGAIHLNGSATGVVLPNGWSFTNWHPFSITSGLVPGPNLMTFYVTNGSFGPTGLRVELAVSAVCCGCTNPCVVDIRCPANITNAICRNAEIVNYLSPIASSTCGPITSLICVPPSGSSFPLGTTTVTCTATDAQGHSASCQFTVTQTSANPWQVTCPPLNQIVKGCPPRMPDLTTQVGILTNCPLACPLSITQNIPAGTVLTPGTHVVILTVCDCTGVCRDCDVIITAELAEGCCQTPPCTITPVLRLYSGADSSGLLPNGSTDPQFLTGAPLFATPNPYVSVFNPGAWVPNSAASKWVGPYANAGSGWLNGVYVYTNRFFLCSTNQASVTGRWTADNTGVLRLNGVTKSQLPVNGYAFASWTPVNITSGFVPGWNELTFVVTNWGGPTGLRTEIEGRACCSDCVYLTCPGNIVTNSCAANTPVSWAMPLGAGSRCGTLQSLTCTPPSGSSFPAGTSTVHCTAVDSCGNAATCSFTVTVRPTAPPPVVNCPQDRLLFTCGNNATAYYKVTATGHVGPVTCTPPSGSIFPLGTTVVTCSATNACGLVASCSFKVTVKRYPFGPPWWDWPCLTAVQADGLPFVPQGTARVVAGPALELPSFGPITGLPIACLTPAPGANVADVAIHTGGAQLFAFTTVLDMEAPDGATVEIVDPSDPAGVPALTLTYSRGTKCYDLKKCKGLISDEEAFRVSAVNPRGELLDSFVQTFNEGNTNAALTLFAADGVSQFPITVILDRRDGTIHVEFPGEVELRACCRRKGWDGTVKGYADENQRRRGWDGTIKGRPPEATRVTFSPIKPHPTTGEVIHFVSTAWPELVIANEQIGVMNDPASAQPVVLVAKEMDKATPKLIERVWRATARGDGVQWSSLQDDTGVSLDFGQASAFDVEFEHALLPGAGPGFEYIEFRTGGHPLAQTNRPARPILTSYLRLTRNEDGVACTVDFSYLPATGFTVQLYERGTLIAQGSGEGPILGADSPVQLEGWPQSFGQLDPMGTLRLTGRIVVVNGTEQRIAGDEIRFVPTPAANAEIPGAISRFECVTSTDVTGVLRGLRSTRACAPGQLQIDRATTGVSLRWNGEGFRLQGAERVTGPWLDLGGNSPVTLPADAPLRAFRLVCE